MPADGHGGNAGIRQNDVSLFGDRADVLDQRGFSGTCFPGDENHRGSFIQFGGTAFVFSGHFKAGREGGGLLVGGFGFSVNMGGFVGDLAEVVCRYAHGFAVYAEASMRVNPRCFF